MGQERGGGKPRRATQQPVRLLRAPAGQARDGLGDDSLDVVFVPVAFMEGFVGVIQRQFALTLVTSVCISGFVALTLTPALCGVMLKRQESEPFWIVRKFNDFFDWSTKIFTAGVAKVLRHVIISLILIGVIEELMKELINNHTIG